MLPAWKALDLHKFRSVTWQRRLEDVRPGDVSDISPIAVEPQPAPGHPTPRASLLVDL
jgi:hypothetical protein